MDFIKQHKELYDKINDSFKDKQKKEILWETLTTTRNLPVSTVKKLFETQRTIYGKLTQTWLTTDLAEGQFQFSMGSH